MRHSDFDDWGGFEKIVNRKKFGKPHQKSAVVSEEEQAIQNRPESVKEISVGDVLWIGNYVWKFEDPKSDRHPGVCCYESTGNDIPFLKGQSALDWHKYRAEFLIIKKTDSNGLNNATAFSYPPKHLRFNTVKNLYSNEYLGRLDEYDRARVQQFVQPAFD